MTVSRSDISRYGSWLSTSLRLIVVLLIIPIYASPFIIGAIWGTSASARAVGDNRLFMLIVVAGVAVSFVAGWLAVWIVSFARARQAIAPTLQTRVVASARIREKSYDDNGT